MTDLGGHISVETVNRYKQYKSLFITNKRGSTGKERLPN